MIYTVKKSQNIFESNPGLDTNDKFSVCNDKQLKFVFLFYDYKSPYAKMGEDERKIKCLLEAGYEKEKKRPDRWLRDGAMIKNGSDKKVLEAAEEFKYIMRHSYPEHKTLRAIDNMLNTALKFMEDFNPTEAKDIDSAMKITDKLPDLIKKKQEIENMLGDVVETDYEVVEDEAVTELSRLDKFNQDRNEIRKG